MLILSEVDDVITFTKPTVEIERPKVTILKPENWSNVKMRFILVLSQILTNQRLLGTSYVNYGLKIKPVTIFHRIL